MKFNSKYLFFVWLILSIYWFIFPFYQNWLDDIFWTILSFIAGAVTLTAFFIKLKEFKQKEQRLRKNEL